MLPGGEADSLYTLLARDEETGDFYPVYSSNMVYDNSIVFYNVELEDKYYSSVNTCMYIKI